MTLRQLVLAAIAGLSLTANAQTLTFTNGLQKYASLTNTTVTMSGKCEVWLTSSTPLSGCTINLNSVDAWLFLPGVKPSVAASTYLGQVRVSGMTAVADSNLRVVQYGQSGALLIPHPSTYQPLTVFSEPQFGGSTTRFSQWTRYTGTFTHFSSFKLKRGYQAVFAQTSDGKSNSKCYVAQDADLEIGVLPPALDKQVQFLYVTPWRWASKKGISGDPGISLLNLLWWYNWNISSSSSRDLEYIAIRQNQSWPPLSQNWQSLGINTLLGYNEPDKADQANMSVSAAISSWPDLLATGLRVASPATSDGGPASWLYPFVSQADAAGLRVDFVAAHYYQGHNPADASGAASQMYNYLLDIWNNTHRPIWITEWNNGANWTDTQWPAPTYTQQQACIAAMLNMLETTPFVERYALYNWVEDTRSVVTNGVLTPAGVTYSNQLSGLSYSQAMPDNSTRGIAQFLFATNTFDTSGYYNNGVTVGAPAYSTGHISQAQAIALDGANSYVQLPANIAHGNAFTFAAWVYWNGGGNWQRLFDFGNDTSHYLFLTPSSGSTTLRFAINNGSGEQIVERAGALASGSWQHVAVTLNGNTAILYVNGAQVASSSAFSIAPSSFSPIKNYLSKSQFPADPLFSGKLDEVEIADYAMTSAQISVLYNNALYPSFTSGVWTNDASGNWGDSNNWSGGAIANGISRVADFSTINNSADRTVTLDTPRTTAGLRFGDTSGFQNWFLSGPNALTLDGGSTNLPELSVKQNTATVSTPLAGNYGFSKTGSGTLALNGANALGGSLLVKAGALSITGGSTTFGNGVSTVGYLTGSGSLSMSGGSLSFGGELRVGGSDQSGNQYAATGAVTVANATLSVGNLTITRGNYLDNSISGTVTLNAGSTLISTNDVIVEFAGTGRGKLALNGGNVIIGPAAAKWLMVGYYDTGAGELDLTNGNLLLENGTSLKMCRSGNTGGNVVNQLGGNVTFFSDAGVTIGGGGNLDLNYGGGATSSNTYNLNGGVLTVPQIVATASAAFRIFNFNGGTLRAAASTTTFFNSGVATTANVRNGGALLDTVGFNVTIGQKLQHSTIADDNATDGGLTKNGLGTLTLTGANTFTGNTTINAGVLELAQSVPALAGNSTVSIAAGAALQLDNAAVTNIVAGLTTNGIPAPNGLYTSANSSGFILGPGFLQVYASPTWPALITNSFSGNTLTLSWPPAQGWRLQTCTNLETGAWQYLSDGTPNATNIPVDSTGPSAFYRLTFP
jgi:autotransporter-associated beta strand protein